MAHQQTQQLFTVGPHAYKDCDLRTQACYNRINALACIMSAGRGWLGASFSCTEMLTAIYSDASLYNGSRGDVVALGKGHAAAMQYACLVGAGVLSVDELLRYELPDGPQAHTDISTPGIAMNTGSLGQTLSKAIGFALARPHARIHVILGDGELQEGQVWEAFMSWGKFKLANLTVIVDANGIQTDSNVNHIMPTLRVMDSLPSLGIHVLEVPNGNDIDAVHTALTNLTAANTSATPTLLLMHTDKGAGLSFTAARNVAPRQYHWHGGVPNTKQYIAALLELSAQAAPGVKGTIETYCTHASEHFATTESSAKDASASTAVHATPAPLSSTLEVISTGAAYGRALVHLATDRFRVLDADLEKSCQLTPFAIAYPERFLEIGAAEQNMVAIAGGLALAHFLPFCNTYANFYRRAIEQVYVSASEKSRVVYAGHYAGLCYATDGKTHQALGDIALFRGVPGMLVLYPAWPEEVTEILEWYISSGVRRPLYIRLHRTPALFSLPPRSSTFDLGRGVWIRHHDAPIVVVTAGPHVTGSCNAAITSLQQEQAQHFDLVALSAHTDLHVEFVAQLLKYARIVIVEETHESGGLFDAISHAVTTALTSSSSSSSSSLSSPMLFHRAPSEFPFSTRERTGLYEYFGLTPHALATWFSSLVP